MKTKKKRINNDKVRARQEIIDFILEKYIRLDVNLDACQGCCENLEEKFGVLRYYIKLIKTLGGITLEQFHELVHNKHDEIWNKMIEEQDEKDKHRKCKYCSPYGKTELVAGEYKNMNMFVDPDDKRIDITCHVGWEYDKDFDEHIEVTEDDIFPIKYCPYCGRRLGDEDEE